MASRSRSRAFALQLLYSADIYAEGLSTKLSSALQSFLDEKNIRSQGLLELSFLQQIESTPKDQWENIRQTTVREAMIERLKEPPFSFYQAQLELPEEWFHEQRFENQDDIEKYTMLLQENIEPMDAYRIVSDSNLSDLFFFFCKQTQNLLENSEDFAPSVVAHWLLRESQLEELINLEIDWTPLFETLCFLQRGIISEQSARILLQRIRKEYEPSNKNERRTAAELAEGKKGKSLLSTKAVRQSLLFERDMIMNADKHPAEPEEIAYTDTLVRGVADSLKKIDDLISTASRTWELDRMSVIDRNILRLGCYELAYQESVPSRVVINESIKLTKVFSGSSEMPHHKGRNGYSDGVKFVNGILDRIARELGKKDLAKKNN